MHFHLGLEIHLAGQSGAASRQRPRSPSALEVWSDTDVPLLFWNSLYDEAARRYLMKKTFRKVFVISNCTYLNDFMFFKSFHFVGRQIPPLRNTYFIVPEECRGLKGHVGGKHLSGLFLTPELSICGIIIFRRLNDLSRG